MSRRCRSSVTHPRRCAVHRFKSLFRHGGHVHARRMAPARRRSARSLRDNAAPRRLVARRSVRWPEHLPLAPRRSRQLTGIRLALADAATARPAVLGSSGEASASRVYARRARSSRPAEPAAKLGFERRRDRTRPHRADRRRGTAYLAVHRRGLPQGVARLRWPANAHLEGLGCYRLMREAGLIAPTRVVASPAGHDLPLHVPIISGHPDEAMCRLTDRLPAQYLLTMATSTALHHRATTATQRVASRIPLYPPRHDLLDQGRSSFTGCGNTSGYEAGVAKHGLSLPRRPTAASPHLRPTSRAGCASSASSTSVFVPHPTATAAPSVSSHAQGQLLWVAATRL